MYPESLNNIQTKFHWNRMKNIHFIEVSNNIYIIRPTITLNCTRYHNKCYRHNAAFLFPFLFWFDLICEFIFVATIGRKLGIRTINAKPARFLSHYFNRIQEFFVKQLNVHRHVLPLHKSHLLYKIRSLPPLHSLVTGLFDRGGKFRLWTFFDIFIE